MVGRDLAAGSRAQPCERPSTNDVPQSLQTLFRYDALRNDTCVALIDDATDHEPPALRPRLYIDDVIQETRRQVAECASELAVSKLELEEGTRPSCQVGHDANEESCGQQCCEQRHGQPWLPLHVCSSCPQMF